MIIHSEGYVIKWERLFKPHILERGVEHCCSGNVAVSEANTDGITAVVEGSEEYDVFIELNRNRALAMECTCPYAEGGENCKHTAAALYAEGALYGRLLERVLAEDGLGRLSRNGCEFLYTCGKCPTGSASWHT